jgi:hypothetical protein
MFTVPARATFQNIRKIVSGRNVASFQQAVRKGLHFDKEQEQETRHSHAITDISGVI